MFVTCDVFSLGGLPPSWVCFWVTEVSNLVESHLSGLPDGKQFSNFELRHMALDGGGAW